MENYKFFIDTIKAKKITDRLIKSNHYNTNTHYLEFIRKCVFTNNENIPDGCFRYQEFTEVHEYFVYSLRKNSIESDIECDPVFKNLLTI